jgi:hypothetical protein
VCPEPVSIHVTPPSYAFDKKLSLTFSLSPGMGAAPSGDCTEKLSPIQIIPPPFDRFHTLSMPDPHLRMAWTLRRHHF